jgi:hypothetical protein
MYIMKRCLLFLILIGLVPVYAVSISPYPFRGLCIRAPHPQEIDGFIDFIGNDLRQAEVNLIVLMIDYNYSFSSRPELTGEFALAETDVKKLVKVCRENNIRLVPHINLLGHQSQRTRLGKLLEVYPDFDETPGIQLPENYVWPNPDGLYCKSYCPLHPGVHEVVFDLVDELVTVFEADAFHAGMDEVFYIGHDQCSRCRGRDKAELFAGEVTRIFNHLQKSGTELWIWGDRLLDGVTTGMGMWEGSYNNTHRAIDMIPKDIVICDWHYERADPTAAFFAAKGFRVFSCPWRKADVAIDQVKLMHSFIEGSTRAMKPRYLGMLQTVWSPAAAFIDHYRGTGEPDDRTAANAGCFRELIRVWNKGNEITSGMN